MIQKIKTRFIAVAMAALFVLLAVIVIGMNIINYNSIVRDADIKLKMLSNEKGQTSRRPTMIQRATEIHFGAFFSRNRMAITARTTHVAVMPMFTIFKKTASILNPPRIPRSCGAAGPLPPVTDSSGR